MNTDHAEFLVACLCAAWCGTCRDYRAGFHALAERFPEARFLWLDVEDDADLVDDYEVENFPTLLIQRHDTVLFFGTDAAAPRPAAAHPRELPRPDPDESGATMPMPTPCAAAGRPSATCDGPGRPETTDNHNTEKLPMDDCIFCRIVRGELPASKIHEDEHTLVLPQHRGGPPRPRPGHRQAPRGQHLRPRRRPSSAAVFQATTRVARAVKAATGCDGVTLFQANEVAGGQTVFHFHIHVLPRFNDDKLLPFWPASSPEPRGPGRHGRTPATRSGRPPAPAFGAGAIPLRVILQLTAPAEPPRHDPALPQPGSPFAILLMLVAAPLSSAPLQSPGAAR
jgi:histidine triad (HIT) family protein